MSFSGNQTATDGTKDHLVVVGRICGVYGVKGWLKVYSFTEQQLQILEYQPWYLGHNKQYRKVTLVEGRKHGKGIVVQIQDIDDRDKAAEWVNATIAVRADCLPELPEGEYYQAQLQGLQVKDLSGQLLGIVTEVMSTGANDVLVLRTGDIPSPGASKPDSSGKEPEEILVPYISEKVVKSIDLAQGEIIVDWDPDY